ncbi:carboxypeptidase regulatory-like domain-containing protein [Flavobacteriaceae bacterium S356]|uniref:Carboxypeptidase regulatory-like domain-containing protein n=1 Tax=Asprobacillus argus TaxID=3076534 RepID=A0ABU3LDU9_9FLAO|nr:carboxypeptidase regulatory-like domain-containing protein [Flavobacteriaceae bacterium S356]
MIKKLLPFLLLFGGMSFIAHAQVTTSKIKGTVTDSKGEVLFGATVAVLHIPTGTVSGTITQENGKYTIPNLRVGGPYKVTFSYVGFTSQDVTAIFLTLGKTTTVNGTLTEEGTKLDEIVIKASSSKVFGKDRTGAQTNVSAQQLKTLPTISRSATDFTRLEPTASGNSFGGRNDQFNNFSLDGSIFNNPFGLDAPTPGGQTDAQPISLDAIEQISVSIAPYDVTLSGFTGASVNAVTKSGTNEFKGTAYSFFRDESLTGGTIKGDNVTKPDLSQTQFGFSIGGPIVKNKVFFFANFEKDDRSDLGTNGWVPNTGSGAINESSVAQADLITVQNALAGLGYNTGRYDDFTYGAESTKGIIKLDWNLNEKNRLALIYNFLNASKEKPAHPTALGLRGPSFQTLQFENSGYEINNNINSFQLELNSTITDKITNKLQVGYTHFDDFRDPLSTPAPAITIKDGNGNNYIIAGHEPFSIHNRLDQKVFQVTNNANFFSGDHTITAGFSFEKFQFDNSFNLGAYGYDENGDFVQEVGAFASYPSLAAFLTDVNDGTMAAALANAQSVADANNALPDGQGWSLAETNVGQLSFYVQDEWNINDDFKLTYGIRFDKPLYFDTQDKIDENIARKPFTFQPNNDYFNPNTNQITKLDSRQLPSNSFLISPRVGFNWDVDGEGVTQVRGGSGVFTGRFPFVWLGNQVQGLDFFFYQVVDPDFKWPQVWRTNVGVDHRFESGLVASADVSYTKDINGAHVQNWGLRNPSGRLNAPGDNRPIYLPGDFISNNAYVFTNSDKGRIWNTTFKLQRTYENGLYTSIAYNYLNAKDVNSIEAEITGDAFDFNPNTGNANNDVLSFSKYGDTHRFVGVLSKKFTFFGGNSPTTITAFFEYAQGGRFNYTYAGNINGDSSFQNNDLLYIPTISEVNLMTFSASGPNGETAQQQAQAFEAYIQQDDYLSNNRGKYMERYGAIAPWRSRWDIKILQDFNFTIKGDKTNTIQLSLDILNFGNLLSSNWGVVEVPNNLSPISVDFPRDINGNITNPSTPIYSFDATLTETFGTDSSLLSRWQMQFGLRYIF